jgi:hypothetical protein
MPVFMVERRFADQLVALAEKHNRNKDDALTIDSEYLEVIAVRHSGAPSTPDRFTNRRVVSTSARPPDCGTARTRRDQK